MLGPAPDAVGDSVSDSRSQGPISSAAAREDARREGRPRAATRPGDPTEALAEAMTLDRAAKAGAIHPNAAARRKSRLTRKVNAALGGTTVVDRRPRHEVDRQDCRGQKAAKARIAAGKAAKAKGAQTAAGKARAALSKTARAEAAAATATPRPRRRTAPAKPTAKAATKTKAPPRRRPRSRPPSRRRPRPPPKAPAEEVDGEELTPSAVGAAPTAPGIARGVVMPGSS